MAGHIHRSINGKSPSRNNRSSRGRSSTGTISRRGSISSSSSSSSSSRNTNIRSRGSGSSSRGRGGGSRSGDRMRG
eukprot:9224430-Pyramimonas_sp.AAC.1